MAENDFQGEMDPELAALLGADTAEPPPVDIDNEFDITGESNDEQEGAEAQGVNLADKGFPEITKRFEPIPHKFFSDAGYYKTALSGEGDIAQRVHGLLQKYLNAKDPKDRSVFRPQLINAFWEFIHSVAKKAPGKLIESKKFLLRFNLLHPTFVDAETRNFFAKLVTDNELNQPVYYIDEWLKAVGTGAVRASTTDEVRVARNNNQVKIQALLEKAIGKLDGTKGLLKAKAQERQDMEERLKEQITVILEHSPLDDFEDVYSCYSDTQKRTFAEIQEILKSLMRADHELNTYLKDYHQAEEDVRTLQDKVEEEGEGVTVDLQAIDSEYDTIRQAAKMTIGRQGNHFPVLTSEYFHCGPNDVGFRENVVSLLARIESIDPEVFCRAYKNRLNRIVPYVILIPTYGDTGICWEPFDKHNRATSRGRVIIPMYPKNLYVAVLSAVADLRWQVAKEKASYYWMEEGLTGNYYQWFAAQKLKGDVKEFFVQDYILWMTKEAEGVQKLDKELRGAFWRYMPFSQEVKDKLRNRSYVYQELCQRDVNRAMSDGY
ncbi:MAG: hypothetical protein LBD18_03390 [Treponema sp.]|jgi:hypothetical protein|nr:hypothetical protein [Treponema sp.]